MTTTTISIDRTETTHNLEATTISSGDGQGDIATLHDAEAHAGTEKETAHRGKPESELRAAARSKGLTLKQLAHLMGVNYSYLSQVSSGRRPWTPMLRESAMAVLGEVPGTGIVYRQGGVIQGGGSSYIRERAREKGLSMGELADLVGLSRGYLTQASRGERCLSPSAQARVEEVLEAPVKVEPARLPTVDPQALWERMDAHGWSQNEVARRAGISVSYLSQIMNGQRTPSGPVLRRLHQVLFAPSAAELVAPVELKVMGWKKDGRNGVVVRGAGGPGMDTIRTGGKVPWGAEVEFAYTTGYDSRGRVSVNHIVDERGYSVMLKQREPDGGQCSVRQAC